MEDHSELAPARYPNLGYESAALHDWLDTVEYAVNLLRSGSLQLDGSRDAATLSKLHICLNDLVSRLGPRLEGLVDALYLAHREAGGSWSELESVTETSRTTLQSRVRKIAEEPNRMHWVSWARGDLNPHVVRRPVDMTAPKVDPDSPWGRLAAQKEREAAQEAAAERAGELVGAVNESGVPNYMVTFPLEAAGAAYLQTVDNLTAVKGSPSVGRLTLGATQEVTLIRVTAGDGWRLVFRLQGFVQPFAFRITDAVAGRLLQHAGIEAPDPKGDDR